MHVVRKTIYTGSSERTKKHNYYTRTLVGGYDVMGWANGLTNRAETNKQVGVRQLTKHKYVVIIG